MLFRSRLCSNQQNSVNKGKNKNNTSGYKGVTWDKNRNKWIAQIKKDYTHIFIGRFTNKKEAAFSFNKKSKELFGKFAYLNKI